MGDRTDINTNTNTNISNLDTGLDQSCNTVWKKILTANVLLFELYERDLAAADLPPLAWYDVLWSLEQAPEQRMRLHELAEAMVIQRSNLTRLIDRLEAKGLVCRHTCTVDRRGAYAAITDAGKLKRQEMWQVYSRSIAKYFAQHISDQDLEVFDRVLNQVISHARAEY
ncbi:transcriptional regulator, MarR family [Thalassoporum mexicanum PCC 7367]|uniref:MarR family winged helix-turn-helix transcriptional regulator n=1 Tax=Thalassoporum mexicanum TaxID=3457544 RepID=UPI00029FD120|nr:MarR family transcriptional regulator [Pseudanabaena sp. PCC 7367]AFY71325.1 transcriptional regulator, MarR family [Pseudanabaena sp. PCC 7367]